MHITNEGTFENHKINSTNKGKEGFYTSFLDAILKIQRKSILIFEQSLCTHIIIDNPVEDVNRKLQKELSRWHASESKISGINSPSPLYFSCHEITPRTKNRHLHLLVWFEATKETSLSLKILCRRLRKFSSSSKVKLTKRKIENRPAAMDLVDPEIFISSLRELAGGQGQPVVQCCGQG